MKNFCVVFVCNKLYFDKFITTCNQLVTTGNYKGNICLIIGDDLYNDDILTCDFVKNNHIIIKHFPDLQCTSDFLHMQSSLNRPAHQCNKLFQYHKFYLFNTFFKQWDYILYLDCGINIFADISPIINEAAPNTLLAHSDAYPVYEWKLSNQFDNTAAELFAKLSNTYNLNIDYFQTTIMLYHTDIIQSDTYDKLVELLYEYPICKTNEQGILSLYFTNIVPIFKQIKTHNAHCHFYDYLSRNPANKYIMLKSY